MKFSAVLAIASTGLVSAANLNANGIVWCNPNALRCLYSCGDTTCGVNAKENDVAKLNNYHVACGSGSCKVSCPEGSEDCKLSDTTTFDASQVDDSNPEDVEKLFSLMAAKAVNAN